MQETQTHKYYMRRALELAQKGLGNVSPNPMVGCVIVKNGSIIGEGFHEKYGEPHAEVNAVNSVVNKVDIEGSTVFVTLEPCAHFGKTPPCANLLVKYKPKEVCICNIDPNPKVDGGGVKILENAGINVITNILKEEGERINRRFFVNMRKKRPYVVLKWAETEDGFVARKNFDSKWISNEASRKRVHKIRSEEDAVLVGFNTARYDNPQLNVRMVDGRDPIRIVLDRELVLHQSLHLFDQQQITVVLNAIKEEHIGKVNFLKIDFNRNRESNILNKLFDFGIGSVLIEGGTSTMQPFIDQNLWDEALVFKSKSVFGDGIKAPVIKKSPDSISDETGDLLEVYYNN